MVYAQILNNIVVNTIELEDSTLVSIFTQGYDACLQIDNLSPVPAIGWKYDGTNFYSPAVLALIQGNLVVNIIQDFDTYITDNAANYQYIVDITNATTLPQIGWSYNGTSFIPSQAYYQTIVAAAITFGNSIVLQAAARNISLGITQAGQTLPMMEYTAGLVSCLTTGSLYQAITSIEAMIADTSTAKTNLAPFINNDALYGVLNQIQTYLNIPLTPNPGT